MNYVKKICPACGHEFIVLKNAEKKAVYCTLECLSKAQNRKDRKKISLAST